jgi:glutamate-1-semialdehyde 2,1-aminomutase
MARTEPRQLTAFRLELEQEYAERFPRSKEYLAEAGQHVLDGCSHAIRWNEPFMPVVRRAEGAIIEDLDGNVFVDYWQGHFANLLGHNPPLIRDALTRALQEGGGLQSGMLHELEGEVAELICARTAMDTVRLTTSGTLGTFYAILLARAFTGRERVLKVSGGWHGSQPFSLKGVSAVGRSFDHLESEGLSAGADAEIVLTRFNDAEDLRRSFGRDGDELACFVVEPVLGAAAA